MISDLSRKISSSFLSRGIISDEDVEVYSYSFEILIATLFNSLAICLFALKTGTVVKTTFYLLAFLPLRLIAGGYHAENHSRCFLILMTVYGLFLFTSYYLPVSYHVYVIVLSLLTSVLLVFTLAPIEDKNKPLSFQETVSFKKKSRTAIICYSIATGLLLFFMTELALSLALGILSVALSLVASMVKRAYKGYYLPEGKQ